PAHGQLADLDTPEAATIGCRRERASALMVHQIHHHDLRQVARQVGPRLAEIWRVIHSCVTAYVDGTHIVRRYNHRVVRHARQMPLVEVRPADATIGRFEEVRILVASNSRKEVIGICWVRFKARDDTARQEPPAQVARPAIAAIATAEDAAVFSTNVYQT